MHASSKLSYASAAILSGSGVAQVRRLINREGLDQWRHYEPWLTPLKEAPQPP